ncbi:hypothetical protein PVAND_009647 [Polypedilum vanderplanki]|uniref:AIMP2 thioredoxin-like domain-containing protein n=1 Tax=Polypedilum vanderplanki TaxID=319348 RepID=A0A9J6CDI5_POLVA|nr:hypothetical protein PVAND_009647 [Polypedilum vanderplanki]
MYSLKPILTQQNIELPDCMYKMKPINNTSAVSDMQESINNSSKIEVEMLEERQNRVLQKLDELKQTLLSMRGSLNLCSKPAQPSSQQQKQAGAKVGTSQKIQKKKIDINNLAEMVVNVHPKNVPYSLLALKNQWRGRLYLKAEVFTHSSVCDSDFTDASREFAEKIVQSNEIDFKLPMLKVTIIWKNVETTQFISSPSKFIPVYGEINIIRYLNRIGPNEFFYENDNYEADLHDQVLDICYQLSKKHTDKERQQFLQQLSQRIGNNQFFNQATSLSISDIAVSSILKKLELLADKKKIPTNLSNWLKNISSIAGY